MAKQNKSVPSFDDTEAIDVPSFDDTESVDGVKKKEDTKPLSPVPSSPLVYSKSKSSSAEGTSANEAYGVSSAPAKPQELKDFNNKEYKLQQESLLLKKKMFDNLTNKKTNLARAEESKTILTGLKPKLETKNQEIAKANQAVISAADEQSRELALQEKARLEQEHDAMAKEFNAVNDKYNNYNKAVVQNAKLDSIIEKQMAAQPSGAKGTSSAAIFSKSIYNATLPALVKSIGETINVIGEVPGMLGGAELPEGMKSTDIIGSALKDVGNAIKTDVPSEAETDVWENPTPENVSATAGSLIGNLINVIGTGAVGGTVSAGVTGMAMGIDESFNAAKQVGLDDKDAAKIALPVGVVNGLMDVISVGDILKGFDRKAINKAISKEAIDYLKDKEITQAAAVEAVQFAREEVAKQAAKGAFKTATKEGATGGVQSLTQTIGEEISDYATNKDKFKNTAKSTIIDIGKNAILEAAGGGLAGGVFSANPSTESLYDKMQSLGKDPEGMVTFNKEVDAHISAGEITPEQAETIKTKAANIIEANNSVPKEITDKDTRVEAIDFIQEKNRLKAELDQIDPALAGDRKQSISDIEEMLKHIAEGTQKDYQYKMNVDSGKYFQIDPSGKEQEITKAAFDLAIKYRKKPQTTGDNLLPKGDSFTNVKKEDIVSGDKIFKNKVQDKEIFGTTREERVDFVNQNENKIVDQEVSVDDIIPTQELLDSKAIQKRGDKKEPVIVKTGGKYFILDGHHRIAADITEGKQSIQAKVIDFDKANTPMAETGATKTITDESNKKSGGEEISTEGKGVNEARKDGNEDEGQNVQGEVLKEQVEPVSPISEEQKNKLNEIFKKNALSKQVANQEVLPTERSEMGLQEVGARDGEPKETPKKGKAKKITIVKDIAENEAITERLPEQDSIEQEPSVAAIESKAESNDQASLNEVVAEIDDKVNKATGVQSVKVTSIKTDESRFQNREKLNEDKVNEIASGWSDADQDPIHVWTDPKNGNTYVLSGHHRLEAAKRAKRDNVKIIDRSNDFTEAEAIKFATEDANANRTMETAVERAKALRLKKERGESKEEINKFLEREGKNKVFVNNVSALNPKGKTMQTLNQFGDAGDRQTQKELEQRADWIGEARRTISGLSDAHENEMFDFLFNKELSKRVTNKSDFLQKVRATVSPMEPEAPLNLARFKNKTQGEQAYDDSVSQKKSEIAEVQKKINDINDRFSNVENKDYISVGDRGYESARDIADKKISDLETTRKRLQKELEDIYREKGRYTGAPTTGDLFAELSETEEAKKELDAAKAAFIKKSRGSLGTGGLQALPEFIEVVKAYVKYGIVTAKDFIKQFRKDFPDAEFNDSELTEAFNVINEKTSGVTHAQTAEVRKEFGMEDYEKSPETQAEWEEAADKEIAKGYNTEKLLKKLEDGYIPTPVEQKILAKYIATLNAVASADPSDENMANLRRAINVSETAAGTALGKSLAARAGAQKVSESLADFFLQQEEASGVEGLTEEQKLQNAKEFNEINAAKLALEEKVAELEAELNRVKAEEKIKGIKRTRKTREDFVAERKNIANDIREKLRKARGELSAAPIPYAKELVLITPDVLRLMKSYVEEGLTKLSDITKAIHDEFKQDIPNLTEKDVTDIIAGKYKEEKAETEKQRTRKELAAKVKDLKDEAALISKLQALENGEVPKSESKKVERNREITELRKKIKSHNLTKLAEAKNNINRQAEKLEKDLKEGNYAPEEKKPKIVLDEEGKKLKDKYIKLKQEREVRLWKDAYENRSKYQKFKDAITEVANIPRALMSSMDFSAPLRQGLVQTVSNPKIAMGAFKTMFEHAASQENFDRWMYDLKESPEWETMRQSKLFVVDPHDPVLSAKEEQFMSNLAAKIPFFGTKLIKGSERAYVSYLNKLRVDLFKRYMDAFESEGKTFENSPELYKAMASYINASTGRGDLGMLENSAQTLAIGFFSPRLIASRVSLLTNPINPKFYLETPKEVRAAYFKDMAKFIGVGMATIALAGLAGADTEDDPRSSDFGKVRFGDTRYDIWGGFSQYVRLFAQLLSGQTKNISTGQIQELDSKEHNRGSLLLRFGRQKLSPIPATATNLITGYDFMGERTDWQKEVSRMLPLTPLDVATAVKDDGVKSLFTVGVPATFGIGVNRYKDKTIVKPNDNTITGIFEIKGHNQKTYRQKKIYIGENNTAVVVTKEQEDAVNSMRNENAEKAIKLVLPELKKLKEEAFKEAVNTIYNRYENEAKDKVFGPLWHDDKLEEKTKEEQYKQKESVRGILGKIPKFHEQRVKDDKKLILLKKDIVKQ